MKSGASSDDSPTFLRTGSESTSLVTDPYQNLNLHPDPCPRFNRVNFSRDPARRPCIPNVAPEALSQLPFWGISAGSPQSGTRVRPALGTRSWREVSRLLMGGVTSFFFFPRWDRCGLFWSAVARAAFGMFLSGRLCGSDEAFIWTI